MKKLLPLLLLAGCHSTQSTGIVPISEDTFMSGRREPFVRSGSQIKAGLYVEANKFCRDAGKKLVPITDSSRDDNGEGQWGSAEIQFKCQ